MDLSNEQIIETLVKDLVKLSQDSHNLLMEAQVQGNKYNLLKDHLDACVAVYERFVVADSRAEE